MLSIRSVSQQQRAPVNETVKLQTNAEDVNTDFALAYENHAREFLRTRDGSVAGVDIIKRWARSLNPKTDVLEIACGGGVPVTRTLTEAGLNIWAIDSSPTLVAEFRSRFPGVPVQCERAQESNYFGRKFGAVVSIGLLFLLDGGRAAGADTPCRRHARPRRSISFHGAS
jgi:2-polyprenyl-3-methyl-5-hydroxy-6-metoxy-1,4-benzoquinol methylase